MAAPTLTARLYSLLFRRTSTFALTIAVGALFFERAFDQGADAIYEHINQGEQKLEPSESKGLTAAAPSGEAVETHQAQV
ncbi:cytochrome b-c1 complex subunit 9 isoform X1 [Ailuropoda melanoleuca]|uniref:cytochrome b-c1 complex subunit 9 isoform X1 n=1 Tax=Ailuropoda melanoleuca TaxID=9646 RepID=UPI001494172E|nr:cytochrome b-c1 complex subunit 9 isoform X1 [Ailuropoda melanoleuca]